MLSLSRLKQLLQRQPKISLQELSVQLQEDHDTIKYLLQYFMLRGQVIECPYQPACGTGCHQCSQANIIYYAWQK